MTTTKMPTDFTLAETLDAMPADAADAESFLLEAAEELLGQVADLVHSHASEETTTLLIAWFEALERRINR